MMYFVRLCPFRAVLFERNDVFRAVGMFRAVVERLVNCVLFVQLEGD